MKVQANGLDIEVEDTGPARSARRAPVLLIMGLGMQLIAWPQDFVDALVSAGHRVVRFDNRDIGLTTHLDHLGVPNLLKETMRARLGLPVQAPYRLHDMAADALGVLDALGIAQAHIVGASMGGMVAQRLALMAPERVLTLTSLMSSSGARHLPGPRPRVLHALLGRPRDRTEEALVAHYEHLFHLIGSPGFPTPQEELRQRILRSLRRSFHPEGTARQIVALAADRNRATELPAIKARTLVLHGEADAMVPLICGQDTARRIPGARLVTIPGMGHDLAKGVVERLVDPLLPHLA